MTELYQGDDVSGIVIDLGSTTIRAGYGGLYSQPQMEMSTLLSVKNNEELTEHSYDKYTTSTNITHPRENFRIERVIEQGKIVDFDMFYHVFRNIQKRLQFTNENPIMFVGANMFDRKQRDELAEFCFETMGIIAIAYVPTAYLVVGRRDARMGMVVDVGATHSTVSVLHGGYLLRKSVAFSNMGTDYLAQAYGEFLNVKKIPFAGSSEHTNIDPSFEEHKQRQVLRNFSDYVSMCQEKKPKKADEKSDKSTKDKEAPSTEYAFFDRTVRTFAGKDRTCIPEILFDPSSRRFGGETDHPGILNMVRQSLDSTSDIDSRTNYLANIFTYGGGSRIQGFNQRLINELDDLPPGLASRTRVNFNIKKPDPHYDAWRQGGVIVGMGTFQQEWLSKAEYENGSEKLYKY